MPKDCQMKDCKWYKAHNYPHDGEAFYRQVCIPPPNCETCCRFHNDNYSPKQCSQQ